MKLATVMQCAEDSAHSVKDILRRGRCVVAIDEMRQFVLLFESMLLLWTGLKILCNRRNLLQEHAKDGKCRVRTTAFEVGTREFEAWLYVGAELVDEVVARKVDLYCVAEGAGLVWKGKGGVAYGSVVIRDPWSLTTTTISGCTRDCKYLVGNGGRKGLSGGGLCLSGIGRGLGGA